MKKKETAVESGAINITSLCRNSIDLVRYARGLAVRHINYIEIMTNYALGKWIVEEQQNGSDRAQYGDRVIAKLSEALSKGFIRGFGFETLKNCRKFYLTYRDRISVPMLREFNEQKSKTLFGFFAQDQFVSPNEGYHTQTLFVLAHICMGIKPAS